MQNKVSIIGAGQVGATVGQYIAENELADIVFVDCVEGIAKGKALDMSAASAIRGFDCTLTGGSDYRLTADSDVVVITSGLARKPGMTREDLLAKNSEIIRSVTEDAVKYSPEAVFIMVVNPLDVMTYLAWKTSGLKHNKVLGMAGVLDSARLRYFVSEEMNVSVKDVQALVMGGHGDSMVPLPKYTTVSGVPITELLPPEKIDTLVERTRKAGAEVVSHLKTGSAYYSPGASAALMVESVLKDSGTIAPCSAYLSGQYGLNDIYIGVPVILGKSGVEKVIELPLDKIENDLLKASADIIRTNIDKII